MLSKLLKSLAPVVVAALIALPASAQVPVPEPDLEIHIAHSHPPRARHERMAPRPDNDSVWVAGYWGWQGGGWVWVPGRWELPAESGATWVRPRYVNERGDYRYEPGHWSNQRVREGDEYRNWKERHRRHHEEEGREHEER